MEIEISNRMKLKMLQALRRIVITVAGLHSGNGIRHINEVMPRRVRLVLGLVTTFSGYTIPAFIQAIQAHSAWPSLRE